MNLFDDIPEGYKIPEDWIWNNVKYPWVIDATGETVKFPIIPLVPEDE